MLTELTYGKEQRHHPDPPAHSYRDVHPVPRVDHPHLRARMEKNRNHFWVFHPYLWSRAWCRIPVFYARNQANK